MHSRFDRSMSNFTRRSFMAQGSKTLLCAAALSNMRVFADAEKSEFVEVETKYGRLRGSRGEGLTTFKGIPYAGSVAGANRFKAAPPLQPWTGVRDAPNFGPPSIQMPLRPYFGVTEPMPSEDCLFLNVWTPAADGRKRPVMFYSHGGGFTNGSAGAAYQDGGNLARTWDVVVVATNHRLGIMGFLYLGELGGEEYATSGNQGILDIRDGLKWVHENIEAFGGDPKNVMIFGESGGGAKTSCLYALPSAEPYFNKASIESGPGIRMTPRDVAAETTLMTLKQLGLEKNEWRKLLEIPTDKLMSAQGELGRRPNGGPLTLSGGRKGIGGGGRPGGFGPVVDGTILPNHPFDPVSPAISKDKPLIVGINRDEAEFFFLQGGNNDVFNMTDASLKTRLDTEYGKTADEVLDTYRKSRPEASPAQIYVAIATARMMGIGAMTIAERKSAQHGAPVYAYIFQHQLGIAVPGTQYKLGTPHAVEIPYKFNIVKPESASSPKTEQGANPMASMMEVTGESGRQAAHNMSEMWSTFARTGHPGAKGQPNWPAYDTAKRATMEIDAQCKVVEDPFALERKLWEKLEP
jgi:para-nitrobenzyl esterase